jgi:hypothetical protein
MNIFRKIKQFFIPEWHTFLLKNGDKLELRVYRNGIRVSFTDLYKTKRGSKILKEYLDEQQTKESKGKKSNPKENNKRAAES